MAKVGNETKLVLSLARERMGAELLNWRQLSSNPNANSNDESWMRGYEHAHRAWLAILGGVVKELEAK